jgi:hypothetical protein
MNPPSKIDQNRENQRNQFSSSPNPIPPGLAVFVFPRVPDAPNKNTSGTHRELCCESTLQTQIIENCDDFPVPHAIDSAFASSVSLRALFLLITWRPGCSSLWRLHLTFRQSFSRSLFVQRMELLFDGKPLCFA